MPNTKVNNGLLFVLKIDYSIYSTPRTIFYDTCKEHGGDRKYVTKTSTYFRLDAYFVPWLPWWIMMLIMFLLIIRCWTLNMCKCHNTSDSKQRCWKLWLVFYRLRNGDRFREPGTTGVRGPKFYIHMMVLFSCILDRALYRLLFQLQLLLAI